jgi:hypothetical protein
MNAHRPSDGCLAAPTPPETRSNLSGAGNAHIASTTCSFAESFCKRSLFFSTDRLFTK